MKTSIINIRNILLAGICLLIISNETFSQGTQISTGGGQKLFIGLVLSPGQSNLNCEETDALTGVRSDGSLGFSGQLEGGYYISNLIGVSTGIGFSSMKTSLTVVTYQSEFSDTDTDTESFEMRVTGSNISEDISLSFINIPLNLIFRISLNDKAGFYIQPGINVSLPVGNKYSGNGTFTYKGFYAAYNLLLENLPDFGFPKDNSTSSEGSAVFKSFFLNGIVNAGVYYQINDKLQLVAGAGFDRSLSTLSSSTSIENFQLSPGVDEMNSITEGLSNIRAQSIGLRVGVRYYIK